MSTESIGNPEKFMQSILDISTKQSAEFSPFTLFNALAQAIDMGDILNLKAKLLQAHHIPAAQELSTSLKGGIHDPNTVVHRWPVPEPDWTLPKRMPEFQKPKVAVLFVETSPAETLPQTFLALSQRGGEPIELATYEWGGPRLEERDVVRNIALLKQCDVLSFDFPQGKLGKLSPV